MNCYSAHLSIDVHCSLRKKKKNNILFNRTSLFLFFIHFIKSGHSFTLILTLSLIHLSFLSSSTLSTSPPSSSSLRYGTTCFFFFSFFSFYQIRSHSLSSLISSLSSSLSQHCRPSLTLSTSITNPRSSPPIGVPDWETHGARR